MLDSFTCSLCSKRKFRTTRAYLLHIRIRHADDAHFRVKCGIHGCQCEYNKYYSLCKHIRRHHSDMLERGSSEAFTEQDDVLSDNDDEAECHSGPVDSSVLQEQYFCALHKTVFKYSLKLREKYVLPASTHEDIVSDCKSLISNVLSCHNDVIQCHLKNSGYDVSGDDVLTQDIFDISQYERLWSDCDTSYKVTRSCGDVLDMIKPVEHIVGNFKSYYISLKDTLTMLVQKEDIAPFILQSFSCHESHLTSFISGDAFRSMFSHIKGSRVLLIHLYNDEFEVVNPIGAHRGKHKMNATYFTLGNLPSKFRSSLQQIHLVNIVKHKAVKDEGYAVAFAPLTQELQELYTDGFTTSLPGGHTEKFHAVLCTVSGDNLSSHALAGFRQIFSSGRVCRVCMISHDELDDKCVSDFTLRCAETHAYHVEAVRQNPDNCAIYGVTGPSIFSVLPYFDVTQGFPADVMHDCMESIMPVITSAVIKFMVASKSISVAQFNKSLSSFVFKGSDRVNKPELIHKDCSIVGSAAQKMCLFHFLPFLVDLVECPVAHKLYVLARDVMLFALCRSISRLDLGYFEEKIILFRQYINEHFPDISVTPKFHFLVHYPLLMARYGPLRDMWCMRFEGKHQYFKTVAKAVGNFINIAYTLAMRHQMLQCHLFAGREVLGQELTLPRSGKFVTFTSLQIDVQQCLCYANSKIWSVKEATTGGCKFAVDAAIVVDFTSDNDPVFIQIKHLLLPHEGHLDIIGKLLIPVAFSKKYYAYQVTDNGWAHFHQGDEKDCSVLWPYVMHDSVYISLPYYIPPWSSY